MDQGKASKARAHEEQFSLRKEQVEQNRDSSHGSKKELLFMG
jgi:hypothetical protein